MEAIFVVFLFLLYIALWKIKEINQVHQTGINPFVMPNSQSYIQKYFIAFTRILSIYIMAIILTHASNIQVGSLFTRINEMSTPAVDIAGFITGLTGLSICLYAQRKMGTNWRVGIDEEKQTELITSGLYAYIRNPTYLGLFLLNLGVWMIWPTWMVFFENVLFDLFLEIQVRCEEDFLTKIHGESYTSYLKRTKRYIPFVY